MRIAILYEDNTVFIEFSCQEFEELLAKYISSGDTPHQAIKKIIADLKQKTLTK